MVVKHLEDPSLVVGGRLSLVVGHGGPLIAGIGSAVIVINSLRIKKHYY